MTIAQIREAVVGGKRDVVETKVREALESGIPVQDILSQGLIAPMSEVGSKFEKREFFVPEMMVAARAMQAGLALLRPHLADAKVSMQGKVVMGTVEGDLHDIGKNLVAMMLEGAGYEIIDLGIDVPARRFALAVQESGASLVGVSALLTTTMGNMKAVIEALETQGVRAKVKVMVGGAPLNEAFARQIGADGYAPDASRAVALAKSLSKQ
jgi:5-methyltetrahydrofolate--homocysteine methyltransferase